MLELKPNRGGYLRPFGCGVFVKHFLLGEGMEGSTKIDSVRGSTQSDINFEYKEALARATARERAEKIISPMVLRGIDVTELDAEIIFQGQLKKISRKFSHMRYHSFLRYFLLFKQLGWVEPTGEVEISSVQGNYPEAPGRVYYRLTEAGRNAGDDLWSNPLYAAYPNVGLNHHKKSS